MTVEIDRDIDPLTGLALSGNGGTELMYRRVMERLDQEHKDKFQIVASRLIQRDPAKKLVYWMHDTWDDPQTAKLKDPKLLSDIDRFVFVSYYQFQTFNMVHQIPYAKSTVIRNGIVPIEQHEKPDDGVINLIYHTTPHRGLDLLLLTFKELYEIHDKKIHLDVYSSFAAYGWEHKDAEFAALFKFCEEHPGITYHGFQPNDVIRQALKKAHIFPYPNTWPETSCLAAIEALSAGTLVVTNDHAALSETVREFGVSYRFTEDKNSHVNIFANLLHNVITEFRKTKFKDVTSYAKIYADSTFDINDIGARWNHYLRG